MKLFEQNCLREYAEVFKTVCVDAAFYSFPSRKFLDGMMSAVSEKSKTIHRCGRQMEAQSGQVVSAGRASGWVMLQSTSYAVPEPSATHFHPNHIAATLSLAVPGPGPIFTIGPPVLACIVRKLSGSKHFSQFQLEKVVEAAGVEPASLTNLPAATTCLVRSKFSSGRLRPDTESPSLACMQEFQPVARRLRA
jgi:Protein of unknown function DUF72